jgi:hypothetical protein
MIYIKLKIEDAGDKELGKCLSFHIAERDSGEYNKDTDEYFSSKRIL